jgi:hypothetical protein
MRCRAIEKHVRGDGTEDLPGLGTKLRPQRDPGTDAARTFEDNYSDMCERTACLQVNSHAVLKETPLI